MKPHIVCVIVNWNGADDTIACLTSLRTVRQDKAELQVVVVDNGSTNDSVPRIKKAHPRVTVLETGKNLGFTGGNNAGITYALGKKADFVWLLNNDTIVDKNVLSFVDTFKDPSVGAVGSKIYFAPGHEYHRDRYTKSERGKVFWYAGGIVDFDNMLASHRGVDQVDHGQYDRIEETPFITGCSIMVSVAVIKKVGTLDDRYYLYLEDLDWCLRIQHAGYKTLYVPTSIVWHVNAGSSGTPGNPLQDYYLTRNQFLIGMVWAPLRTKIALLKQGLRYVFSGSAIRRKAIFDAVIGRTGKQYEPKKSA